jgi:uncharacterized protein YdhG (YjbR/CyaY superfamily)
VSREEVDAYLATLEEPKQSTLRALRHAILAIVPEAEQCISYAMPTFKVRGKAIAGFAAFKNHLSYFPHSGSVIPVLQSEVAQYKAAKGTLRFPIDQPLPTALVEKLVAARMRQAFGESRPGGRVDR